MVKFFSEVLDKKSPAVLVVIAMREAMNLRGDETKQVSEILQMVKKVMRSSSQETAVRETANAVVDKFCKDRESHKAVKNILQENIEVFK